MVHVGRSRVRRRMIRKAIRDEVKAARDYEQLERTGPPRDRKVIKHIRKEEQHHRSELEGLLVE